MKNTQGDTETCKSSRLSCFRMALWFAGLVLPLALPQLGWAQFSVDNPQEGDVVAGNVAINGFHCEAQEQGIRLQFDNIGTPTPIGLTQRADILISNGGPCDDIDDGFVANFLWALLPEGPHQLRFFLGAAATPFATVNVTVSHAVPGSVFLSGVSGECVATLSGGGIAPTNVRARWNETLQNMTIVETGVAGPTAGCPADMVEVGDLCVDRYEASVFPDATGSGTQLGRLADDYSPPCQNNGIGCQGQIYALSRAGVVPSRFITWFQAQQACANMGKRLLTNAEWQLAAVGTPDPGATSAGNQCHVDPTATDPELTGDNTECVSEWGVYDMVGNVDEWVTNWLQGNGANVVTNHTATYGMDRVAGVNEAGAEAFPPALLRGGAFGQPADDPGVYSLDATMGPDQSSPDIGFRCAQPRG